MTLISQLGTEPSWYAGLAAEEKACLNRERELLYFDSGAPLAKEAEIVERAFLILDGIACQYKLLPDGRRQISTVLLPGDLSDTFTPGVSICDQSLCALVPVRAAAFSVHALRTLARFEGLSYAFACNSARSQNILRTWLVNVGRRSAFERLSHFLCEIVERLRAVGLIEGQECTLPFTQSDIADSLALTPVHVNRTLMEMRRAGLVSFQHRHLVIHNWEALQMAADFDAGYLRFGLRSAPGNAVPVASLRERAARAGQVPG